MDIERLIVSVVGGTGDLGSGLAFQLAKSGIHVVVGSRSAERAEATAIELSRCLPRATIEASDNEAATDRADVVIMAVPYASHDSTLDSIKTNLQGKILVDTTVPLMSPKVMRVQLPEDGSVARRAQRMLGKNVSVVSAFQNVAAHHLRSDRLREIASDVLVCGDDVASRETVIKIAERIGLKAWHAGPIDNSAVAEALTSVLIFLNKRYSLDGAGIRIVSSQDD